MTLVIQFEKGSLKTTLNKLKPVFDLNGNWLKRLLAQKVNFQVDTSNSFKPYSGFQSIGYFINTTYYE